ncbi:MAG: sialidase family protein [Thaumarchaeota archaeon]|nr:sialidase family protein [Nitrososphaerota archaeon]
MGFADIQVFAESITISQITETDSISQRPQIFSQNEKIFLVWTEKYENNAEILFSKSSDGGITFSTPINLSKNEGVSAFPRISVSGDSVFVTWYDYSDGQSEIYFAKSEDGGETFSVLNISNNTSASYNPWVSSNSKFVYLVWNDGGKSQEIEFADGKKRIVDVLMGNMEIFFATSNDDGRTFETKNLSNIHGESLNPRMRINEENIYVTWTEQSENSEIFFSKSEDSGKTFSNPINISNSPGNSFDVGIEIHENEVFLIWKEKSSEHQEVFFSKSVDNGNTFDYPIKISGTSTNVVFNPITLSRPGRPSAERTRSVRLSCPERSSSARHPRTLCRSEPGCTRESYRGHTRRVFASPSWIAQPFRRSVPRAGLVDVHSRRLAALLRS